MTEEKRLCAFCENAAMREDICGIFCRKGLEVRAGRCPGFQSALAEECRGEVATAERGRQA